jgi:protein-L-isoaspartate(D-aspartate) O-methyltransferase
LRVKSTSTVTPEELSVIRRAYARQILALAGADNPAVQQAFADTPLEKFLGPGPWLIAGLNGLSEVPADPVLAYQDVLFALAPEKQINNGQPSLHASWLHRAEVARGQRVAHIGAGAGYYSAILSRLVGPEGEVLAVEIDSDLVERARKNLADLPNVKVVQDDGRRWPVEPVDCVYVNFAVERPAAAWLEGLREGGRLVFPLASPRLPPSGAPADAGLRVQRLSDARIFAVDYLDPVFFVCADPGDGDFIAPPGDREALAEAFARGGVERVRSLRWRIPPSPDQSWFVGSDWSLSFEPA